MNRKIWQEIRKLIQTPKQVFYRTRYLYREAELFQGTDWSGIYDDPASKMIVIQVLQNLVDKGSLAQDKNMPAPWFSSQVNKGVDDLVLFRFFRQGLKEVKLAFWKNQVLMHLDTFCILKPKVSF